VGIQEFQTRSMTIRPSADGRSLGYKAGQSIPLFFAFEPPVRRLQIRPLHAWFAMNADQTC
jgi:hypothetical protein